MAGSTSPKQTSTNMDTPACDNAFPLRLGEIVDASTVNKSIVNTTACGIILPSNSLGVWFKYEPTAPVTRIRITTCTDDDSLNGDFDSQMEVYRGECDSLQCGQVNDNDFYSSSRSQTSTLVVFIVSIAITILLLCVAICLFRRNEKKRRSPTV
jgi:hypothetical protein